MNKHWRYLKYVLRHKWFVLVASWRIGAPIWRALVHDMSKFRPSEWFAYAEWFYGTYGWRFNGGFYWEFVAHSKAKGRYDLAWFLHQKRNAHHWQYWLLVNDEDGTYPLPMPERFAREMVADWMGAGRAITGKWECAASWYEKNRGRMQLHHQTREFVEQLLDYNPPPHFDETDYPNPETDPTERDKANE